MATLALLHAHGCSLANKVEHGTYLSSRAVGYDTIILYCHQHLVGSETASNATNAVASTVT